MPHHVSRSRIHFLGAEDGHRRPALDVTSSFGVASRATPVVRCGSGVTSS